MQDKGELISNLKKKKRIKHDEGKKKIEIFVNFLI